MTAHGIAPEGRRDRDAGPLPLPDGERIVRGAQGRVYRVGRTDRELLGYPRWTMVLLPWVAMLAISVFEYAYGAAEATLAAAHHWSHTGTFWVLSVWIFFQAAVAYPAGRLREKGAVSSRTAMLAGSVLCLLGFVSLAHAPALWWAVAGFGLLGGTGAGLVYATCINTVGKWYPERRGGKTGFVNGGFAYGAVPFIFLFSYGFDAGNYRAVLDLVGVYVLLLTALAGFFFKDPPKNWWPAHVPVPGAGGPRGSSLPDAPGGARATDPPGRVRAKVADQDVRTALALRKNPPAAGQFTPRQALRTGRLPLMWLCLLCTAGVSIFGISFQVPFAKDVGFGPLVAASSMGIMSVVNGTGRGVVGWVSDRLGRRVTLTYVCVVLGLAQFGVLWAGQSGNQPLFLVFAFVSGFGGGAFFPLFAALVPDYFGENHNASNYGLVYSSKLVSGLLGGGLGAAVAAAWGYAGAYATAGCVGLLAAGLSLLLRRPGSPPGRSDGRVPGMPGAVRRAAG
ncbi:OFA family MFS transporter [Streptomyces sp. NPDC003077]|uniref:OFA family MFS transporter n=1 Tax=Streptomyces sp. NPDC003077 TaxID=3154443 RepID=UPI0033B06CEC